MADAVLGPGNPGARLSSLRNKRKGLISVFTSPLVSSCQREPDSAGECALAQTGTFSLILLPTPSVALGSPPLPQLGTSVLSSHT